MLGLKNEWSCAVLQLHTSTVCMGTILLLPLMNYRDDNFPPWLLYSYYIFDRRLVGLLSLCGFSVDEKSINPSQE